MNKLRKALTIGVMVMTVIAGFGPSVNAAAPQAGDLIKMDGLSTVYFLGNDGKRYVYPHSSVFFTWHKDFSGVVTVSSSELASYPLGSNVVMKAGTKLVKITTDPSVYAVEPNGVLRKISSEADAIALYGSMWSKRVVDVADSFFTNYTVGTPLTSGQVPAGSLVKNANSASVYYFDGTNYRTIASESAFNANRFDFANVITVTSAITAGGNAISGAEFAYDAQGGSQGTVVTGSGLTVSLSAATPAAASVPMNGTRVPFAKYNVTAANDGAVTINSITIKRTGLSDFTDFSGTGKIWMEKDGVRVTSQKTLSSNDEAVLTFTPALTVNAGQTVSLEVLASLNTATGNAALSIASASAVSATAASISGSFPVTGNLMNFTDYSVAQVKFDGQDGTKALKVGDTKADFGSFELSFATTSKDVIFKSVILKNTGAEDLAKSTANLYLEKNGTVISGNAVVDGRYATFTLNNNGLLIEKGDSISVKVKGDVMAKENTGTSTIFNLNKAEDISIVESNTGFGAEIILTDTVLEDVTVAAGSISSTIKTPVTDTEVIKGSKGITSLIANVRADEAITADGLKIAYTGATTTSFENAKVYVNGTLLGSFDPATSPTLVDSSVNFKKGDNEVKVTVDVKSDAVAGANIKFSIVSSSFLDGQSPEYVASGNAVTDINGSPEGAKVTVQGAGLTVAINDGFADGNKLVKGVKDITLAKFNVKALYDNVRITSITLDANNYAASTTLRINDSSVYDMKLYVDGVQIGSTRDFNSGATFSSLSYTINKDTIKSIELKGSFDTANTGFFETNVNIYAEDTRGKAVSSLANNTKFHEITGEGSLTVALGADTKATTTILAKTGVEQEVGQYRLTAVDDAANITELTATTSSTIDPRISEYRLYDGATLLATENPLNGVITFKITDNKLIVAANSNKIVTIKAVLNAITTSSQTNSTLQTVLTGYKFKSSAGTETSTTTLAIAANAMNVRKTMPTFALVSGVTGGQGTAQSVLTFSVTADANEDVVLTKLAFTESGSASGTAAVDTYSLYEGDVEKVAANASTTMASLNLTVAKGTTKTYTVKANTSAVPVDATFGLSLEKGTAGANIGWAEYFVTGNIAGTGEFLNGFPISGSTLKY